jgi:hypothetical protein
LWSKGQKKSGGGKNDVAEKNEAKNAGEKNEVKQKERKTLKKQQMNKMKKLEDLGAWDDRVPGVAGLPASWQTRGSWWA